MENNNKTRWINTILSQMGRSKGAEPRLILENCGRECLISSGSLEKIENLRNCIEDKTDIQLLFTSYKEKIYENRPNLYRDKGAFYLEYQACGCGMVTEGGVTDPFLCNCTLGYTRQIFETLFGRAVKVELLQSILNGDRICKQRISLV